MGIGWYFTTYKDSSDGVNLWDILSPVMVPRPMESLPIGCFTRAKRSRGLRTPQAGSVRGLQSWAASATSWVIGTIMYINDGAGGPYGTSLGSFAPAVSSWLNDVMLA